MEWTLPQPKMPEGFKPIPDYDNLPEEAKLAHDIQAFIIALSHSGRKIDHFQILSAMQILVETFEESLARKVIAHLGEFALTKSAGKA